MEESEEPITALDNFLINYFKWVRLFLRQKETEREKKGKKKKRKKSKKNNKKKGKPIKLDVLTNIWNLAKEEELQ